MRRPAGALLALLVLRVEGKASSVSLTDPGMLNLVPHVAQTPCSLFLGRDGGAADITGVNTGPSAAAASILRFLPPLRGETRALGRSRLTRTTFHP